MSTDLYASLGLARGCNETDIKKAYKKLALQHHPDRGGDREAFEKIQEAYDVLSDPDSRQFYDMTGNVRSEQQGGGFPGGGFTGGFVPPGFPSGFPGFGGHPQQAPSRPAVGPNQEVNLSVTLEEVFAGRKKKVTVTRRVVDRTQEKPCGACQEQGVRREVRMLGVGMFHEQVVRCEACHGMGWTLPPDAIRQVREELDVEVPKGCRQGTRLTLRGKTDENPGQLPGDLILHVVYEKHPVFRQDHAGTHPMDIDMDLTITLLEALTGFSRIFRHPSGSYIRLNDSGRVVLQGDIMTIPGKGLDDGLDTGHIHVHLQVEYPSAVARDPVTVQALSEFLQQKKTVQKLSSGSEAESVVMAPFTQGPGPRAEKDEARNHQQPERVQCAQQ